MRIKDFHSAIVTAILLLGGGINAAWAYGSFRGPDDFQYGDFLAPTDLIFQGAASLHEDRVRLVPAEQGKAGGLWFQKKPLVQNGFETTFRFQLTDQGGHGANGLAFVVQNNPTPGLGRSGHGMGFRGVANALVIKFDPYHYSNKNYVKYDQIAVMIPASSGTSPTAARSIGSTTNLVFTDEKVHTVKITYTPGKLQVFFDQFKDPLLSVPLNLAEAVSLDQGQAWVGFTSATGADYFNHDLLSWTFFTPQSGATPAAMSVPPSSQTNPNAATSSQPERIYLGSPGANPAIPLVPDPAFGYAMPSDIALTHKIEASTDLVHWVSVTNAVLYFRDPDSTNYENRFYRFSLK